MGRVRDSLSGLRPAGLPRIHKSATRSKMAYATSIAQLVAMLKVFSRSGDEAICESLSERMKPYGPEAIRPLITLIVRERHFRIREWAVDCAAQIDARLAADELLEHLSHPDEDVRRRVCEGLARLKDPRATPYLRTMLKAPEPWKRRIAMHGLGDLRDEGSVDDLVGFLRSSDCNDAFQ